MKSPQPPADVDAPPGSGAAKANPDPDAGFEALVRRAQSSPHGLLETIQLDHALRRARGHARDRMTTVRLAVLSSATVEHLLPAIRVGGLRHRLWIETYTGAYGQYRQELLGAGSSLPAFSPDIVLLSLTLSDLAGVVPLSATRGEVDRILDAAVEQVMVLWRTARERLGAAVIQQSLLDVSEPVFGSFDGLVPGAPARLTRRLNDRLADAALEAGVLWLDVARAAAEDGLDAWFDARQWLHAKVQIALPAAPRFGELVGRVIAARRGLSRKCLVLDLDNTIWGGVAGDDGIEGIALGEGSAVGEAHLALQRYARTLKDRGIILAVCSRNDPAVVEAVFRDHPDMVLRREDIAAFAVNWNDKVTNLQAIAEELNIGLDSLVFVDDNPAERAHVRESLPMVAVPDLPEDPSKFVRCVSRAGYFEAVSFTDEDRHRTAGYAANAERSGLKAASTSLEDFLRGLNMIVSCGPVGAVDLERAAQLVNKTNQFNTTGRRYAIDDLGAFCGTPGNLALRFRLSDRFGDSGLVSVLLLRPAGGQPRTLDIDCWVMSCRVFGRRLEYEAMNAAVEAARRAGAAALSADFRPTARNGVISRLYEELGFSRCESADPAVIRWRLPIDGYVPHETAIRRAEPHP